MMPLHEKVPSLDTVPVHNIVLALLGFFRPEL
jgi:hypothetical protein